MFEDVRRSESDRQNDDLKSLSESQSKSQGHGGLKEGKKGFCNLEITDQNYRSPYRLIQQ